MLKLLLSSLFFFKINSKLTTTELKNIQLKKKTCIYELQVRIEDFEYIYKESEQELQINIKITFTEYLTYQRETIQSTKWSTNRLITKNNFIIDNKNNIELNELNLGYDTKGNFYRDLSFEQIKKVEFLNKFLELKNKFSKYDIRVEEVGCDLDSRVADIKEIKLKVKKKKDDGICGLFKNDIVEINMDLIIEVDLFKKFHFNDGSDELLKKFCKEEGNYGKFKKNKIFILCQANYLRKKWFF